jgi:hypothetical protein
MEKQDVMASNAEKSRAARVSAAVDRLLRDPEAQPEHFDAASAAASVGTDAELLAVARQLARLPELLGPVEPALEQRVMCQVQVVGRADRQAGNRGLLRLRRAAWAAAGLLAVALVVLLLTPFGQTAVASFMAVFHLGRTDVSIAPVYTPPAAAGSTAIPSKLTLREAKELVSFPIPQPAYLPPGYRLSGVNSYTYPNLPAWVPQPFFVELVYEEGVGDGLVLGVYSIQLGDQASISRLDLQATPIEAVQDVDVNGQPGVLLRLAAGRAGTAWQQVVWEHEDLILVLSSTHLTEEELLQVARSVR